MEWLTGNSFFILLLLVCIGMHFFGHGHGHGKSHGQRHDGHEDENSGSSSRDGSNHYRRKI